MGESSLAGVVVDTVRSWLTGPQASKLPFSVQNCKHVIDDNTDFQFLLKLYRLKTICAKDYSTALHKGHIFGLS